MRDLFHKPRKRFGQHFLTDDFIINKIIRSINPSLDDALIEIGPGRGALTLKLQALLSKLTVIELDRDLIPFLQSFSTSLHEVFVVNQDVLAVNFADLCPLGKKLRLVGNLPYNISTTLIFYLLEFAPYIEDMHFMLQKEVVDRMSAAPNSKIYGRLSVMTQYHFKVVKLFDVTPGCFTPPPKVQSSVVKLIPHITKPCLADNEMRFAELVRVAFSNRRKMIANAIKDLIHYDLFIKTGISGSLRPEQLSLQDFVLLANNLPETKNL